MLRVFKPKLIYSKCVQKGGLFRVFSEKNTEFDAEELRKKRIYEKLIRDKVNERVEQDIISEAYTSQWRKGVT